MKSRYSPGVHDEYSKWCTSISVHAMSQSFLHRCVISVHSGDAGSMRSAYISYSAQCTPPLRPMYCLPGSAWQMLAVWF